MARPVDPERHRAQRLRILDAAVTCFADKGFERTTTAAICATAGVGSGTLFHYFPTKAALLTALFAQDTEDITAFFAALDPAADPWAGVLGYVDRAVGEAQDLRIPGLLAAMLSCVGDPGFATVLAENDRAARTGLQALANRAAEAGRLRGDLTPEQVATWVVLLIDGFFSRILSDPGFDVPREAAVLRHLINRLAG